MNYDSITIAVHHSAIANGCNGIALNGVWL